MVVPKGARVCGTGYLRIIKVRDYKVAYSKRRYSVYKSEINVLMLPCGVRCGVMGKFWCNYCCGYATRVYRPCCDNLARLFYVATYRMYMRGICCPRVI